MSEKHILETFNGCESFICARCGRAELVPPGYDGDIMYHTCAAEDGNLVYADCRSCARASEAEGVWVCEK